MLTTEGTGIGSYAGVEITGVARGRSLIRRPRRIPESLVPETQVPPVRVAQSFAISRSVAATPWRWSSMAGDAAAQLYPEVWWQTPFAWTVPVRPWGRSPRIAITPQ